METKERRPGAQTRQPAGRTSKQGGAKRTAAATQRPAAKKQGVPAQHRSAAQRTRSAGTATRTRNAPPARRQPNRNQPSPDVVYVQPAPFNRTRFILCLLIVVAVVLAVVFGMSIFFKVDVDKITVSGTNKYTPWQIREASGIKDGENLFSISGPRISSTIQDALPYVNKVRVGIKLPDTVKIEIEELDVVYSVQATDESWWLIRSDGCVVEKTNAAEAEQHTKLLGIAVDAPQQGQQAKAWQPEVQEDSTETAPVTVLASEQFSAALSITQYLEDCGIIGQVESIDVTNMGDLQLWYGDRYQVELGDSLELSRKIRSMKAAMDQMGDYQSGVLDVSFTVWPNEVGYTPFS
jgi:predicted secreted protein